MLASVNTWQADYGGSDVYVVNMGGKYHDDVCSPLFTDMLLTRG